MFQYVSIPGRSYRILVPIPEQFHERFEIPERVSEFDERFDLTIITENVIARQLSGYAFDQEPANKRFTERVRLEIAVGGNSIDAVIQGTVGRDADGKVVLMALHRVVVQIPIGAELELGGDIRAGHYPFRGRPLANACLKEGSPLLLTKAGFEQFWTEIDDLRTWGFKGLINGASVPEGAYTFAQAFEQPWCQYQSLARFLSFLKKHYPYFESGFITEVGFNGLMAEKKARRALSKAKSQKTARANTKRHARQTSLGADLHGTSSVSGTVQAKISCPQK